MDKAPSKSMVPPGNVMVRGSALLEYICTAPPYVRASTVAAAMLAVVASYRTTDDNVPPVPGPSEVSIMRKVPVPEMVPPRVNVTPLCVSVTVVIVRISLVSTFNVAATVQLSVCTVQVPLPSLPAKVTLLKEELPHSTVLSVSAASSVTVPPELVNVALLSQLPPTVNVPVTEAISVPVAAIVTLPSTSNVGSLGSRLKMPAVAPSPTTKFPSTVSVPPPSA